MQSLQAEEQRWAKAAKQLERRAAAKQEAERCRKAVRLLTAEVQELHEMRGRLEAFEKANLTLTNKLLSAKGESKTKNFLVVNYKSCIDYNSYYSRT